MVSQKTNSWELFVAEATDVFVAKNTDYESRFMRALVQYHAERGEEAARTIWAWEVEKKLDRCRTWLKRGELQVKGEGVRDSVIDLFNYTVQYRMFRYSVTAQSDPFEDLNERGFYEQATMIGPEEWLHYLTYTERLIKQEETQLRALLLETMTGDAA
jgi:hypothetical protein